MSNIFSVYFKLVSTDHVLTDKFVRIDPPPLPSYKKLYFVSLIVYTFKDFRMETVGYTFAY